MQPKDGFTLIELLTTLALISILISASIPALENWAHRWQLRQAAQQLARQLRYARQAAIFRSQPIITCPLQENGQCPQDKSWQSQVSTWLDDNQNNQCEDSEQLQNWLLKTPLTLTSNRSYFIFGQEGSTANSGTLQLRHPALEEGYDLVISNQGMVRLSKVINK